MVLARKRRKNAKSSYCLEDVCQAIGRFVKEMLLFFIRYQLAQGNSLPVKAAGISSSGIGISNCQNIDWFKMFRQFKLPAQNVRIKIAYPNASQAQFRGLQHHMVCQNRGVNVAGLFFVKGTNPCLLMVCADNDGQG